MRKVTFIIDDEKFFREDFKLNKYELTDHNGVKMSMRDLNGYQHRIIINDCYSYFEGRPYQNKADKPCGVIQIIDEEI